MKKKEEKIEAHQDPRHHHQSQVVIVVLLLGAEHANEVNQHRHRGHQHPQKIIRSRLFDVQNQHHHHRHQRRLHRHRHDLVRIIKINP